MPGGQPNKYCPCCNTRRVSNTATHLVDRIIAPEVTLRQWVLTVRSSSGSCSLRKRTRSRRCATHRGPALAAHGLQICVASWARAQAAAFVGHSPATQACALKACVLLSQVQHTSAQSSGRTQVAPAAAPVRSGERQAELFEYTNTSVAPSPSSESAEPELDEHAEPMTEQNAMNM